MKTPITLTTLCLLLAFSLSSCKQSSRNDFSNSELPVIDLEKEYPVKRIDIHEIADVEYIPLETTDESLIGNAYYNAISDKYIVIADAKYYQILIFDRQGKFIRAINKTGQGPGEYISFHAFDVDFDKEELYLYSLGQYKLWVYSFEGKFLREFKYDVNQKRLDLKRIDNFNQDYLITYNDVYWPSPYPEHRREADKTPYYLINKENGAIKIVDKQLTIPHPVPPYLDRMVQGLSGHYNWTVGYQLNFIARNGSSEYLLVENAKDTLYLFENQTLKPSIIRTPSITTMKDKRFISPCALTDKYFIYRRVILDHDLDQQENTWYDKDKFPAYILNRTNNEIFQVEVYDSNLSMEHTLNSKLRNGFPGNGAFHSSTSNNQVISVHYPHQLDSKIDINTCKGKFKEIYSKIKEDDNPILVVYTFK